ncbi:MAG: IS21 family transposase [bacterium]
MLKVDDYGAIRRARRDGKSIRQIARELNHSRNTVRKILGQAEPEPIPQKRVRNAPQLGLYLPLIQQILKDDESAPPKQRHTAAQIYRRLCLEHQYQGSYSQVRRHVQANRRNTTETFIPLAHPAGHRMEADFGHIHVDFPDGRRLVPFLVVVWAYSNAPFVMAMPFERTEAILEGLVAAFEFFGAVPRELWWDNPKTVAKLIQQGRDRVCHPRYAALASHYVFSPKFCMPARGNEKPDAESTVKAVQKRFATPVPQVANLDELNSWLRQRCELERDREVRSLSGTFIIRDRLAQDLQAAAALPAPRFDPCVIKQAMAVDKYQTVAFDGSRYSVPREFAYQTVTVKGYVSKVSIVAQGRVVATHKRSMDQQMVLDPIHFLATLARKPGAMDHAPVFRDWDLPACFALLRTELERIHGPVPGSRRIARVLQLLIEHPLARVKQAIESCLNEGQANAELVIQRVQALARLERSRASPNVDAGTQPVSRVDVPMPNLNRFDQLLCESICTSVMTV